MVTLTPAPIEMFWYWISERHRIFVKRQEGLSKPWTDDPILQSYKFTNPFRQNDRGTVWLRENFLEPHQHDPLADIAFNICWYRMFNWWGTGKLLGWQTSWPAESIKETLADALARGEPVFTGAHIVYSPPGRPKIDAIVDVCTDLYHVCHGAFVDGCREDRSLQGAFEALTQVHCVGGFMAYEMVTDMRHTRLLEDAHDINKWANVGPGAIRGLKRLGMPCRNQEEALESMRELLDLGWWEQAQLEGRMVGLPILELRDIEHSLCEFDKYWRVKSGEGRPRGTYPGV